MTLDELKRKHPRLIEQIENSVLERLGLESKQGQGQEGFTEDKLTPEEKRTLRINARNIAGM